MKAGRALEALVAEKVMGEPEYWSVRFGGSHYGDFKTLADAELCAKKIQGDYKAHIQTYFDCPHYSTDIRAAWEVVEKFRRGWNGHAAACVKCCISDYVGEPDCSCTIYAPDIAESRAWADEMPLAICLAALKAADVNVGEK